MSRSATTQDRLDSEPSDEHILVTALGETLVETDRSLRVLETFHPPTYYLPPEAMRSGSDSTGVADGHRFCEWKGVASYFDVVVGDWRLNRAVWNYPNPSQRFLELAGWFALYPQMMDSLLG